MNKIAVIVPVFNRKDMLIRALSSVFTQSRQADEVVVIDDASVDDLSQARHYAETNGAKWVELPENEGPAQARNCGVSESTAEWITFLDSDDLWEVSKLERQLAWHQSQPEIRISQVGEKWIRNGEMVEKPTHWEQKSGPIFAESVERCSIGPSCVMISRGLWEEFGGFNPRFRVCEDYELWLRITSRYEVGLVGGESLVQKYAGHEDQLSASTVAMDRFRVVALLEHVFGGYFDAGQRALMIKGIQTKSAILSAGAKKRGALDRSSFYGELAKLPIADLSGAEARQWISGAWQQIDDQDPSELQPNP